MELFIAGIAFTLFVAFGGYKVYQARERRLASAAYIPPSQPTAPRDYDEENGEQ